MAVSRFEEVVLTSDGRRLGVWTEYGVTWILQAGDRYIYLPGGDLPVCIVADDEPGGDL